MTPHQRRRHLTRAGSRPHYLAAWLLVAAVVAGVGLVLALIGGVL
jgi:hypothetical protein